MVEWLWDDIFKSGIRSAAIHFDHSKTPGAKTMGVSVVANLGEIDEQGRLLAKNWKAFWTKASQENLSKHNDQPKHYLCKQVNATKFVGNKRGVPVSHTLSDIESINHFTALHSENHLFDGVCVAKRICAGLAEETIAYNEEVFTIDLETCVELSIKIPTITCGISSLKVSAEKELIRIIQEHPNILLHSKPTDDSWERGMTDGLIASINYVFSLLHRNGTFNEEDRKSLRNAQSHWELVSFGNCKPELFINPQIAQVALQYPKKVLALLDQFPDLLIQSVLLSGMEKEYRKIKDLANEEESKEDMQVNSSCSDQNYKICWVGKFLITEEKDEIYKIWNTDCEYILMFKRKHLS